MINDWMERFAFFHPNSLSLKPFLIIGWLSWVFCFFRIWLLAFNSKILMANYRFGLVLHPYLPNTLFFNIFRIVADGVLIVLGVFVLTGHFDYLLTNWFHVRGTSLPRIITSLVYISLVFAPTFRSAQGNSPYRY